MAFEWMVVTGIFIWSTAREASLAYRLGKAAWAGLVGGCKKSEGKKDEIRNQRGERPVL